MATLRIRHTKNYTCISNQAIRDQTLSFKARGIHHLLLSFPDDWAVNTEQLSEHSDKDGRDAIAAGLRELEKAGYIQRQRLQDPKTGKWRWESVISETPITGKPVDGQKQGKKNTIDGKTVDGLSVDGKPVTGKTVDGLSVDGKPVDILSTVLTSTVNKKVLNKKEVLCEESKPESEGCETESHTGGGIPQTNSEPVEQIETASLSTQTTATDRNEAIDQDQYSAAPNFSEKEKPEGAIATLIRMRPNPDSFAYRNLAGAVKETIRFTPLHYYPWNRDEETLKRFMRFMVDSMGTRMSEGDRDRIAKCRIQAANHDVPGSEKHDKVWLSWQEFLEGASRNTHPNSQVFVAQPQSEPRSPEESLVAIAKIKANLQQRMKANAS